MAEERVVENVNREKEKYETLLWQKKKWEKSLRQTCEIIKNANITLFFDEEGVLSRLERIQTTKRTSFQKKLAKGFTGCWELKIEGPGMATLGGTMRLDFRTQAIRASGDIYLWKSKIFNFKKKLEIKWYPQFKKEEYHMYFKSKAVCFENGKLYIPTVCRIWDTNSQDYFHEESGWFEFERFSLKRKKKETLFLMKGHGVLGNRIVKIHARKTGDLFRGCRINVFVPEVYSEMVRNELKKVSSEARSIGFDVDIKINVENDKNTEYGNLKLLIKWLKEKQCRDNFGGWKVFCLIGYKSAGSYGVMFDWDDAPRSGFAVFAANDVEFEAGDERQLNDYPEAFRRTFLHEFGHALNLMHPHDDMWIKRSAGDKLMRTTKSVKKGKPQYPKGIDFSFSLHNQEALVHEPDVFISPGMSRYGFGRHNVFKKKDWKKKFEDSISEGERIKVMIFLGNSKQTIDRSTGLLILFTIKNDLGQDLDVFRACNYKYGDQVIFMQEPGGHFEPVRPTMLCCPNANDRVILHSGQNEFGSVNISVEELGIKAEESGLYRFFILMTFTLKDGRAIRVKSNELQVNISGK